MPAAPRRQCAPAMYPNALARLGNQHAGSVQAVSLAFLDAVAKNDPVAGEWRRRDASCWLAGQAGLWIR